MEHDFIVEPIKNNSNKASELLRRENDPGDLVASTTRAALKKLIPPESTVLGTINVALKKGETAFEISLPYKFQRPNSYKGKRSVSKVPTTSPYKTALEETIKNTENRKKLVQK